MYAIAVTTPFLPSVCLSVTLVRPTQPVEIVGNFSSAFRTLGSLIGHPMTSMENFTDIVPGNPSVGGFKRKRGSQI